MAAAEYCSSCNEAVLWKCTSCEKENDRSVHSYHPAPAERLSTAAPASMVGVLFSVASGLSAVVQL